MSFAILISLLISVSLAVAASAEAVGTAAGVGALHLGLSSAVSGAVSTAATIGTYTVAGGIAASTLSDAGEIVTDGHNVIRDDMIAPLAGPEHASEIYDNSKLMLTLASLGITQFAADNPQFRPLPKDNGATVEKCVASACDYEKLFENLDFSQVEEHVFSPKHLAKGIMDLGTSKSSILESGMNIVKEMASKNLLKEGPTQVRTIINGYEAEIRLFVKNGKIIGFDMFKGHSSRAMGNTINY